MAEKKHPYGSPAREQHQIASMKVWPNTLRVVRWPRRSVERRSPCRNEELG
jgi:hypothetical protein